MCVCAAKVPTTPTEPPDFITNLFLLPLAQHSARTHTNASTHNASQSLHHDKDVGGCEKTNQRTRETFSHAHRMWTKIRRQKHATRQHPTQKDYWRRPGIFRRLPNPEMSERTTRESGKRKKNSQIAHTHKHAHICGSYV